MLRCKDCGNTELFITEKWFLHWIKVDGDGKITQIDGRQGDSELHLDDDDPHIECGQCYSTNVEEDDSGQGAHEGQRARDDAR